MLQYVAVKMSLLTHRKAFYIKGFSRTVLVVLVILLYGGEKGV